MSDQFNKISDKSETMLDKMIFFGKAHYFVQKMIPCIHDSLNIYYSKEQLKEVDQNDHLIWAHFIEKKLLFETRPFIIQKYIGESPKISEIGEKCPGRIGRWLGWQIVRKYMEEHPKVTLSQLMAETNSQKIFTQSKYKPELK